VVLQPGFSSDQITPSQVIDYCRDKLAAFKLPRYIEYMDEFPHTSSGKIAKQELDSAASRRPRRIFDRSVDAWR
jgi:long-chain acyl-CoA synthetase